MDSLAGRGYSVWLVGGAGLLGLAYRLGYLDRLPGSDGGLLGSTVRNTNMRYLQCTRLASSTGRTHGFIHARMEVPVREVAWALIVIDRFIDRLIET